MPRNEHLPRLRVDVRPEYPQALERLLVGGDVEARCVVAPDGRADMRTFVTVRSSHALLKEAVRAAVARSVYAPDEAHGEAVPVAVTRVYRFEIARGAAPRAPR